jgi:hypothetical protein
MSILVYTGPNPSETASGRDDGRDPRIRPRVGGAYRMTLLYPPDERFPQKDVGQRGHGLRCGSWNWRLRAGDDATFEECPAEPKSRWCSRTCGRACGWRTTTAHASVWSSWPAVSNERMERSRGADPSDGRSSGCSHLPRRSYGLTSDPGPPPASGGSNSEFKPRSLRTA